MNRPPPVEALLRADPHEAANTLASLLTTYPGREKRLEVVIPQAVVPEIKIFHGKSGARHLANPDILVPLLPGTPVLLVHGSTCGYLEGDTTVEHFKDNPGCWKTSFPRTPCSGGTAPRNPCGTHPVFYRVHACGYNPCTNRRRIPLSLPPEKKTYT